MCISVCVSLCVCAIEACLSAFWEEGAETFVPCLWLEGGSTESVCS